MRSVAGTALGVVAGALGVLFAIGVLGSVVVIILSTIEDAKTLFHKNGDGAE
jgi:hypothetical protein